MKPPDANDVLREHGPEGLREIIDAGRRAGPETLGRERAPPRIRATPYTWQDPATIPVREWLYGRLLIRKFVTATVAGGGKGKTSLLITEALSMVSGKNLLGVAPKGRSRVWFWNLEDPHEEITRRIQAIAKQYGLNPDDFGDRLFVDTGREQRLIIAETTRAGAQILRPVVEDLVAEIMDRRIDALFIDPFVSCHEVTENDNSAMDMIAKEWGKVADRTNGGVHLAHHARKGSAGEVEVSTESSRGGKALTDACRVVRVINPMTEPEAKAAGVEDRKLYFRTLNDKQNLAPPQDKSDWFKLESVDLLNGPVGESDHVGVVVAWQWPDAFAGVTAADLKAVQEAVHHGKWREDVRAKAWVGIAVAKVLGLDPANKQHKARIQDLLKTWIKSSALVIVEQPDERHEKRDFVGVGEWAN